MLNFILDTDTCIYWLNGNKTVEDKIINAGFQNVAITIITVCELYYGAYKSSKANENLQLIHDLLAEIHIENISSNVAETYGKVKVKLEKDGNVIDDADLLIASIALSKGATLVTNNLKHFKRIENLSSISWV